MGRSGPLPQSDNVRMLRGNPSHRRPPPSLKAKPGVPTMPTTFDRDARDCWKRIVPELDRMGILSTIDRDCLQMYAESWSLRTKVTRQLRKLDDLAIESADGRDRVKKHPLLQTYRDLTHLCAELEGKLGLTPAARLRLTAPKKDEEGDREDLLR